MHKSTIPPEVLNRHISAALMAVVKELHKVQIGVKVTNIVTEATALQPQGLSYHIACDVLISGNVEPVVLDVKPEE